MLCPKCGANNSGNARFCESCGEYLQTAAVGNSLPNKKRRNRIIGVIAGIIAAAVVMGLFFYIRGDKQESLEEQILGAWYFMFDDDFRLFEFYDDGEVYVVTEWDEEPLMWRVDGNIIYITDTDQSITITVEGIDDQMMTGVWVRDNGSGDVMSRVTGYKNFRDARNYVLTHLS